MNKLINKVKAKLKIDENFVKAETGTRSQVFLSDNYVLKINNQKELITGESHILQLIKHLFGH